MQPVSPIFGKLTTASIPWDQPLIMTASLIVVLGSFSVFALITYLRRWGWLWREWLTTTDHKKIGIMYTMLSLVMLLRGFSDVILMRSQQAIAAGGNQGFLASEHYNQVFTAHGTIMIFFMAMPFITGLMNFAVPLQIGARDVAFPMVNGIAFWLTATGALLVNISLGIGEFARTGWIAYPPLSELAYSPGVGVDYYLVALSISGIGTLIGAVNLVTTILKMRAPGMTMMRLPIFTWTALATNILIVAAFPILTATFGMLLLDRYVGMHFFTNDAGGNPMMYINLIWMWGHPEVYILILPAFGVFSEVISTFSGKPLFGYRSMVLATMSIAFFAFTTWGHHFYTMGSGADVNGFFSITTMIIAVPTGVKVFNWLFTMYRGRIRFEVPMLWAMGFIVTFVIGGMTGVLLAEAPVDFELHNSVFLVAHFHNVIIGGVFFGVMAGYNYWFPKAFGFTLDARLGKIAFWCWFIGFYTAFLPLYQLGLMGMTRRLAHYDHPEWQPYLIVALIGALIVFCGILAIIAQLYVSIRTHRRRVAGADPWDGRTLEWSIASPPPAYNFAVLPEVSDVDAYWGMKQAGRQAQQKEYTPFDVPKPSWCGFMISFFAVPGGFAVIWHIWWLAAGAVLAILAVLLWNCWGEDDDEVELTTDEIARTEAAHPLVPA